MASKKHGLSKKRKKSAIIRYFVNKKADDDEHIKSIMLLFHPFRNEVTKVHNNDKILDNYKEYQKEVQYKQRLFEPNHKHMDLLENIDKSNV